MSNCCRTTKVLVLQKKTMTKMTMTNDRKAEKVSISLVALFMILAAFNSSAIADPGSKKAISWMPYDSAIVKAKKENKHVLIHFTTTWCGWCKKMIAETYTNPNVMNLVNSQFVTARVDGDSYGVLKLAEGDITEKGLTMQYGVRSYPTTFFLEPGGTKIAGAPGYLDTTQMLYVLGFISGNYNEDIAFTDYVAMQQKLGTVRPDAKLKLGMTPKQVKASWGEPTKIEPKTGDKGPTEEWLYGVNQYLIFKEGKLRGFQERDVTANSAKVKATNP